MHDKIIKRGRHIGGMRNVGRKALVLLIAVMTSGVRAGAVTNPNGLAMDSVHPEADSLFIARMRAVMDRIRRTEHRPTVALVLSGGGAKGAAETGAMKFLEEKGMPVDIICGTSIGGLIGGLTSIGYKAEDIEDLFRTSDWGELLTDRIHPKYYTLHAKRQQDKFIVSIPFLYEQGAKDEMGRINEGAHKSIFRSLPSGFAYGFNVGNILSSLTVGYQDSLDFDRLPIPFVCVAADLVSCKEKNWGNGELKTAMRSTMSIPGLFEPVRTDGMVLVDGGVRNNFPVDIIRAIGADYVIGIDLSDTEPEYEEVNNIVDIGSRFMTMLGTDSFERNKDAPDILIKPDLTGYNMMSFTREAVDTMLDRGYAAAVAQSAAIDSLKAITGSKTAMKPGMKATDIRHTPVRLGSIRFEGISEKDGKYLLRRIGIEEGQIVDADTMKDAMSKLQATGCFESINYSLLGREEPFDLVFRCRKSPVHQFGAGVRFDTEEWLSLILNLGLNTRKLSGSKFDFTLKLGGNQKFTALYTLDLPDFPTINAKAEIFYAQTDLNSGLKATSYSAAFWSHTESLFLSNMKWKAFDINAGIRNKFFGMPQGWFKSSLGNSLLTKDIAADFLGLFINGTIYTMDDKYFPHYGAYFTARYSYDFLRAGDSDFRPISVLGGNLRLAIPLGGKFTIEPDLYIRSIWDNNREQSLAHKNFVGGSIGGRYMEQQIPFIGFQYLYMYGNFTTVANLRFRYNPMRNLYFSALGGYVRSAEYFDFLPEGLRQSTWGAGLQAAYNTIVGPIKLDLIWSDLTNWGWQMSIGFDF